MTRQQLLDALTAERFAPRPESRPDNHDGPTAMWETAERVVEGPWLRAVGE